VEPELMMEMANLMWKTCVAEGVAPQEFDERGLIGRVMIGSG
jgi:hypothetical protein